MADEITTQRSSQYDRTLEKALTIGQVTPPIGAKSVTVTLSGEGAISATVMRHPAHDPDGPNSPLTSYSAPGPESPHWADASPDDPMVGELAPGAALVADFAASGFAWWAVRLDSGPPVTVFMSVDGITAR